MSMTSAAVNQVATWKHKDEAQSAAKQISWPHFLVVPVRTSTGPAYALAFFPGEEHMSAECYAELLAAAQLKENAR